VKHGTRGHGDEVAVAVVIDSFDEAIQLKKRVMLGREKKCMRATPRNVCGGKEQYLGRVGRCFAEIDYIDINLHFLEFFGHLSRKRQYDSDGKTKKEYDHKAHLHKLLDFIGDGRGDENDDALGSGFHRSAKAGEP
jgi:hypothetical protein